MGEAAVPVRPAEWLGSEELVVDGSPIQESEGHWVTITDHDGISTHIMIGAGGRVEKGPRHLVGANVAHLPPGPGHGGDGPTTHHRKDGSTPAGHDKHPDYTEHKFTRRVYGVHGPGVGHDVHNPLPDVPEHEVGGRVHNALQRAREKHAHDAVRAGTAGPADAAAHRAYLHLHAAHEAGKVSNESHEERVQQINKLHRAARITEQKGQGHSADHQALGEIGDHLAAVHGPQGPAQKAAPAQPPDVAPHGKPTVAPKAPVKKSALKKGVAKPGQLGGPVTPPSKLVGGNLPPGVVVPPPSGGPGSFSVGGLTIPMSAPKQSTGPSPYEGYNFASMRAAHVDPYVSSGRAAGPAGRSATAVKTNHPSTATNYNTKLAHHGLSTVPDSHLHLVRAHGANLHLGGDMPHSVSGVGRAAGRYTYGKKKVEVFDSANADHVVRHEVGHAVDHALGVPSLHSSFGAVYAKHADNQHLWSYMRSKPQEMFAEGYAMYHEGGSLRQKLKADAPEVHDYMAGLHKHVQGLMGGPSAAVGTGGAKHDLRGAAADYQVREATGVAQNAAQMRAGRRPLAVRGSEVVDGAEVDIVRTVHDGDPEYERHHRMAERDHARFGVPMPYAVDFTGEEEGSSEL